MYEDLVEALEQCLRLVRNAAPDSIHPVRHAKALQAIKHRVMPNLPKPSDLGA